MRETSVAVVMSTFNEEHNIDRSLDAIAAQTIRPHVVVVDGGSRDRTVERLRSRAALDPHIHVYADGVRRSLPAALNLAIDITQEAYVAKVDARTFIQPDFIERAMELFRREGSSVGCVGGRPEQYGETAFGEGLARARMSRFGVGGSGYADPRACADVDTVQCGIYRRSALLEAGGFDQSLQFGEDEEVNWRLRQAGYRIVRHSSVRFRYLARSTWREAFSQYRNYGRARTRVLEKHPEFIRARHLVPSVAVLAGAALCGAAPISRSARLVGSALAMIYAGGAVAAATAASRDDAHQIPYTAVAFTALHLGYGIGLLEGSWHWFSACSQRNRL